MTYGTGIATQKKFMVGEWLIEPDEVRINKGDISIRLEPKVMDFLVYLASRAGETVAKDELIEEVWQGVIVGDEALQRCVSKLRNALDDDARDPQFIATVPKRGYKLLISPKAVNSPILPNELAPDFVGAQVGDSHFFSSRVKRFAAVGLIVLSLALVLLGGSIDLLKGYKFAPAIPTTVEQQYERALVLYVEYERDSNERAIVLFERIIEEQESFAPAYAGISKAYAQKYLRWTSDPKDMVSAFEFSERAIALSPNHPESLWALGMSRQITGDVQGAIEALEQAFKIASHNWNLASDLGDLYAEKEQYSQAKEYYMRAVNLSDRHPRMLVRAGDINLKLGVLYEAEQWYRNALDIHPLHDRAAAKLASIYEQTGQNQSALDICQSVLQRTQGSTECALMYGRLLIVDEKYESALRHFSQYQKFRPEDSGMASTYKFIAEVKTGLHFDLNKAVAQFSEALSDDKYVCPEKRDKIDRLLSSSLGVQRI
ncbi:MAG: hypothetical protein DHS20C05_13690 [Hyphococcus sp.]|nr:MAG: hypothetical protein DHS20C05_13690 [Marinicaulis sp.]